MINEVNETIEDLKEKPSIELELPEPMNPFNLTKKDSKNNETPQLNKQEATDFSAQIKKSSFYRKAMEKKKSVDTDSNKDRLTPETWLMNPFT